MKKNNSESIKTVLTITVGLLIVFLITKWFWALLLATTVGVLGISSSFLAKKINYLWMKLAWLLSLIIPNILLTIIFYVLLFPIALLSRIFGQGDIMHQKNITNSLYKEQKNHFTKASFEKPW